MLIRKERKHENKDLIRDVEDETYSGLGIFDKASYLSCVSILASIIPLCSQSVFASAYVSVCGSGESVVI